MTTKEKNRMMLEALGAMLEDFMGRHPDASLVPVLIAVEKRGMHFLQPAAPDLPPQLKVAAIEWADGTRNERQSETRHEIPNFKLH